MPTKLLSPFYPNAFASSSPELAYFLGFMWGDGYLYSKERGASSSVVSIEILSDDMNALFIHFARFCDWRELKGIRKKLSSNTFHRIYSGDRSFYRFLSALGYTNKFGNHDLALRLVSPEHERYFYRGLLDSDGSIARYKGCCIFTVASGFDQDWLSLESYCKRLGVPFKVGRRVVRKGKSRQSSFNVTAQGPFFKLLDEIYRDADSDGIYLPRKYHKYLAIKRMVVLGIRGDVTNGRSKIPHTQTLISTAPAAPQEPPSL